MIQTRGERHEAERELFQENILLRKLFQKEEREKKKKKINSPLGIETDHPWRSDYILVVGWKTVSIGLAVPETDDLPRF